ncbi:MAG: response regulator [Acidobacteria bacterium]|jgi:DNA-binding NtrC family response regulator|uniref:Response regulator n=1 Tax=Candidatus Polarisedimenticola svalbardensis TaxID=2886004 RepID=A0A8J6XTJ2_9BACT|nr:response regulator [Candidatus Polarisedimenticola svalbardensis]
MNDDYKPKILVVDDEPMVTRTLEGVLRMDGTLECTAVNRPAEGLDHLGKSQFDVILSDFIMPELDGLEFLSKARELQPEASRILLTGYADKESAIRSINEIGLYQYIEKPWHNQQLLMILRNAAERTCLLRRLNNGEGSDGELRQQIWKMLI